jgi:hypothetical protein
MARSRKRRNPDGDWMLWLGLGAVAVAGVGVYLAYSQNAAAALPQAPAVPTSPTGSYPGVLTSGMMLSPGQTITSPSGTYGLTLQTNGNLMLFATANPNSAVWQSNTGGSTPVAYGIMQSDGNFVLYQDTGSNSAAQCGLPGATGCNAVWSTGTSGQTNAFLEVTDQGTVLVAVGTPSAPTGTVWSSS